MRSLQETINKLADNYTRHYCIIGVVVGVLLFIVLTIVKPNMWVIWLLFSAFIGWAHGYLGMSILGVVYIIALFLYPFIHLFAKKESAQKIYYGINGKEGIQCIVLFLTILFPLTWMICEPSGKTNANTTISSIANFADDDDNEYVYICTGPYSKKYHKTEYCQWLGSCNEDIERVTLEEAEDMGRTPCKGCYGN